MPSTSAKQHRFMAAIAHSPSFAKKVGVSQSVGKDFTAADKGKTFNKGGMMKNMKSLFGGKESYGEEMKEAKAIKSGKITPKQYAMGEESEKSKKFAKGGSIRRMADGGMTAPMAPPMAPQAPVDPRKLAAMQAAMQAQGGAAPMAPPPAPMPPQAPGMKRGGSVKYAKGGGIESRGKTKGTIIRMASGGSVSSASRRADGIAQRGKTRC